MNNEETKLKYISNNILNKSRNLSLKTKGVLSKISSISKREVRQTTILLDIISMKILKGRKISEEEMMFIKLQGKDITKIIPLILIQGIPIPIPITPLLIVYGKKIGIDLIPKDNEEPIEFKNKNYNMLKVFNTIKTKKKNLIL